MKLTVVLASLGVVGLAIAAPVRADQPLTDTTLEDSGAVEAMASEAGSTLRIQVTGEGLSPGQLRFESPNQQLILDRDAIERFQFPQPRPNQRSVPAASGQHWFGPYLRR